ncbi:hypothetical protein GA0061098_101325 [Bradyrhizobium shewense]|uniref:Uncharacterized protein n=2 Tax=Bradyrhizobium shewense TaxID=1761772 RepID=A0A1C3X844_9BRAD|nr:hypothetical protein GA0061098_101325 [Bradyrhizobium shewense]
MGLVALPPVNNRDKHPNPRIATLHCATVSAPDSQDPIMNDDSADFSWRDIEAVVVRQQDAIAVYSNPDGDLVIRRRRAWDEDDDVWIVVAQTQIRTVIDAMEKVLTEVQSR